MSTLTYLRALRHVRESSKNGRVGPCKLYLTIALNRRTALYERG